MHNKPAHVSARPDGSNRLETPPVVANKGAWQRSRRRARWLRCTASLGAVGMAAATLGTGVSQTASATALPAAKSTSSSCSPGATKITFWAWAYQPDIIATFNKTHPGICVVMDDVGAAAAEYTKIQDAIKAGSGTPDVAEIEYFILPSFEVTHSLLNLVPYGADAVKKNYVPAAWGQVSQGKAVYAMPVDLGPLGFVYNESLFSKYHLSVPKTWAQFSAEAAAFAKDDPGAHLTSIDWTDPEFMLALMQQSGAFPFQYSGGAKVGINFTGKAQMRFANYWQKLLSAHDVTSTVDFSASQISSWDKETSAVYMGAAWGPGGTMNASLKKTIGDWRVAPMPQSTAGAVGVGNWGGSSIAVLAATKHPKQAAEFAKWFGGTAASWKFLSTPIFGAFPSYKPELDSSSFLSETLPLTGTQHYRTIFAQAAKNMSNIAHWPPLMSYAITAWPTAFAGVANGTETLAKAFRTIQGDLAKYATAQGFSVSK